LHIHPQGCAHQVLVAVGTTWLEADVELTEPAGEVPHANVGKRFSVVGEGETFGYPRGADPHVKISEHLQEPCEVLLRGTGGEVDVAGRRHRGSVQLACVTSDDDVLDAPVVEGLDDLERVEALAVQTGSLVFFFRARRAADTAARSFATRVAW
jgi:hypothetical protein